MQYCACGLITRNSRVLLARRSPARNLYPDCWDILGGHLEAGETPVMALVRELEEEVGITATDFRHFDDIQEPDPVKNGPHIYHIFHVTGWRGGEPRMLGDEHTAMGWFDLADTLALDLAIPDYAQLIQRVL